MLVLNFGHPLTDAQRQSIECFAGQPVEEVLDIKSQFDHARPFAEQVAELVGGIPLTPSQWQGLPLLVNPPSLAGIACVVLAELHGRMGYFPPVLRLRPMSDQVPPKFEVAEIVDLQGVRERARGKR